MVQLIAFYEDEPVKARNVSVLQTPFADATGYTFGNEPMTVRTVYVPHPTIAGRLVPYGQYDSLLMNDQQNEALRIVQMLGAHTVITRSFRGDLSKVSAKARLPLDKGGTIDAARLNREEVSFEQIGTGGPPQDPGPTRYPDAAGFEAARHAVLLNGARHVELSIESQSAFRFDSDIAGVLKKLGFSLGFSGEKSKVRLLKMEAWFPERGKLHTPHAKLIVPPSAPSEPIDPAKGEGIWSKFKGPF